MQQRVELIKAQISKLKPSELGHWFSDDPCEIITDLNAYLNDYRDALPIISALKEYGAYELISVLNNANNKALRAFARLNINTDLEYLINTFLVDNDTELDLVNRDRLIQFLRLPDLSGWLTRCLESLDERSIRIMSLRLSILSLENLSNKSDQYLPLRALLSDYPIPIDLTVLFTVLECHYNNENKTSADKLSSSFLALFYDAMNRMNALTQIAFIKGFNKEYLPVIINSCVHYAACGNPEQQQISNDLLFLIISHANELDDQTRNFLKNRLCQVDSYLFDPSLGSETSECPQKPLVEAHTGEFWLQSLLSSTSSGKDPQTLKRLSDRYRLIQLLFNTSDVQQLTLNLKDESPFYTPINDSLIRIEKDMANHPEAYESLSAKKLRLIQFTINQSLTTLLARIDTTTTTSSLLYIHYSTSFPSPRSDLLFHFIENAYRETKDSFMDVGNKKSIIKNWFNEYLPNQAFNSKELQRKKEVWLYNATGQPIACLNEANEAIAFVNNEPSLLIKTGAVQENDPLYNKEHKVIGYITKTGHLKNASDLQKNTCAQLLALVPERELEQSSRGLELLVNNVLFENSIEELYKYKPSDSKRLWLEKQITQAVQNLKLKLPQATCSTLVTHTSKESLFYLLGRMTHQNNSLNILNAIINNDEHREVLFSGLFEADFHQFLKNNDVVSCFAHYLTNFHDKPWFSDGLLKFAQYAKKYKKVDLLSDTLAFLKDQVIDSSEKLIQFDAILKTLIGSEQCAEMVLKNFLNEKGQGAVQRVETAELSRVTTFYDKQHIVNALQQLNKTSFWESKSQYRLLLHVFYYQQEQLFSNTSVQAWESDELDELGIFVNRHLSKTTRAFDHQFAIGYSILGELIFRSAQLGQTSLFYTNKILASKTANLFFSPIFLKRLIDKFWIPDSVKEQYPDDATRIKLAFGPIVPFARDLAKQRSLLDWLHLINQTWNENDNKNLPAICVFMMNYTGHKKPLAFLIHNYIKFFQHKPDFIHPISQLLQQFPQRDFSAVLFDTLEAILIKNPQILDSTILRDMAKYYALKIQNKDLTSDEAAINLLIYFGQNKNYLLVQKGCEELTKHCDDQELKTRLIKGALEAKVEHGLNDNIGKFYFGLIKTVKRLWHYGLNPNKNSSKIVKFCDDDSITPQRKATEKIVKTPAGDPGNKATLTFKEKRKQFISLLATIKRSPVRPIKTDRSSIAKQSLFSQAKHMGAKDGMVSKKGMSTI